MPDNVLPMPQPQAFSQRMRYVAAQLRAKDAPAPTLDAWRTRKASLREAMFRAMGPMPEKPCPLEARTVGTIRRPGYQIEKVVFQSRPDVWVTSSLYVPDPPRGKHPAVLVVHGHWRGARRDPVVQARCLGLVQLGFVVLAVDAFGAGERNTTPTPGTYHGALYGSTLWPSGHTLLGMQVYDNQRAVDYLCSRPEVDGARLGITGASGGGNQSMYAGALDERFGAVVPVCSVGNYQAYLRAACCVCEVLPGALTFTEEGDVLGLIAPRGLLVINATRDGIQFSVEQSRISVARAQSIFDLHNARENLRHAIFESPHDYNQPMREAMYGWMTLHLKKEGKGEPIPEPKHQVETIDDLACFPEGKRPERFTLLPAFAARAAHEVVERVDRVRPDHLKAWEAVLVDRRTELRRILGAIPEPAAAARVGETTRAGDVATTPVTLEPETGVPVPLWLQSRGPQAQQRGKMAVVLHLDGKAQAAGHPVVSALLDARWNVVLPDLRATGETKPERDAVQGALDHTSAEHGLWIGRPLLGQWIMDLHAILAWIQRTHSLTADDIAVLGIGPAGLVALAASALGEPASRLAVIDTSASLISDQRYPQGTSMGVMAPGFLRIGDVPHLAALSAPRRLVIANPRTAQNQLLDAKSLESVFAYPRTIYRLHAERAQGLRIAVDMNMTDLVRAIE
jgi:dienelactone hydrolase